MPIRGAIKPIIVPMINVPTPIQSVEIQTKIVMNTVTEITSDLNGTNSLQVIRFDRANIREITQAVCHHSPHLKSL